MVQKSVNEKVRRKNSRNQRTVSCTWGFPSCRCCLPSQTLVRISLGVHRTCIHDEGLISQEQHPQLVSSLYRRNLSSKHKVIQKTIQHAKHQSYSR